MKAKSKYKYHVELSGFIEKPLKKAAEVEKRSINQTIEVAVLEYLLKFQPLHLKKK